MSRQFTVAEAAQRECPFKSDVLPGKALSRTCSGPRCMCWVWTTNPKLEAEVVLAFTDEHEQSASSVPTTDAFELPAGAMWEPYGEPEWMALDEVWRQRFFRKSDPERRGRCGVVAGEMPSCPR